MSMRIISWEEYIDMGNREWGVGSGECTPLALTIGVFDGVHRGHQSLIQRICAPTLDQEGNLRPSGSAEVPRSPIPDPRSLIPDPHAPLPIPYIPTVITFRQNPLQILNPSAFPGNIMNLDEKLRIFEDLGVRLAVLIDFSEEFSKINGRGFVNLLLRRSVHLIAVGRNFRCGYRLDTGAEEIRRLAGEHGVEVWVAPPVMDGGQPVSSSRVRQALAAGRQAEAERLLGRGASPLNISS